MNVKLAPLIGGIAAVLVVVLLAVSIGGYLWLDRFLRGEECRKIIGHLIGQEVGLAGGFQPLVWTGFSVYSGGFSGARNGNGPVAMAEVDRIRAELRLASLFRGVWEIPEITVERLEIDLTPPLRRADGSLPEAPPAPALEIAPSPALAVLPRQVKVGKIICRDATVIWPSDKGGMSRLRGAKVTAEPDGRTWTFQVEGGRLLSPGFPEMTIDKGFVRLNAGDFLFLESRLRDDTGGTADLRGKVDLTGAKRIEMHATFRNIDVAPFLDADWRRRVTGRAEGELQVAGSTGAGDLRIRGPVRLREAQLEALPILNTVALLTQTQEFRTLRFKVADGTVDWSPAHLAVSDLNVESELLLKVMGQFRADGPNLSGNLMVGTTPRTLRIIPGATEKVFTTAEGGYVWTPVVLGGTVDAPTEDLTPRLQQAAVGTVLDAVPTKVREKAGDLIDTLGRTLGF